MAGKGSRQRPIEDRARFESNWERIFGKKEPLVPVWTSDFEPLEEAGEEQEAPEQPAP